MNENTSDRSRNLMIERLLSNGEWSISNYDTAKGNHGNTRLPYGLCKKYGIDLPDDATPKEAWEALSKKTGITAKATYSNLRNKKKTHSTNSEPINPSDINVISFDGKKKRIHYRNPPDPQSTYTQTLLGNVESVAGLVKPMHIKNNNDVRMMSSLCRLRFGCPMTLTKTRPCYTITPDDYDEVFSALNSATAFFGRIAITEIIGTDVPLKDHPGAVAWAERHTHIYSSGKEKRDSKILFYGYSLTKPKSTYGSVEEYENNRRIVVKRTKLGQSVTEYEKEKAEYKCSHIALKGKETMSVFIHELSHSAKFQSLGHDYDNAINDVYGYAAEHGDIKKYLSHYAATNIEEFFAEATTAYIIGLPLPKYIRDMVELPLRVKNKEVNSEDDLYWGCSPKPNTN